MKNYLSINSLIPSFNKVLNIPGDKSLSIRWVLLDKIGHSIVKNDVPEKLISEALGSVII